MPGGREARYISVEDVSKTYGTGQTQVEALRHVSIAVDGGEFIVVVGPSGCGKSTLVRCLAGIEDVTEGRIVVSGVDVTRLPAERRNFEWLPQRVSATFFANRALERSLQLGPKLRGESAKATEAGIRNVVNLLRVSHLLNRTPGEISGGELQRMALARALLRKPVSFLFDEPLSSLDERLREEVRAEFRRIHRETGETFIYVTHDQREALSLATRCIVMHQGRVEQCAAPQIVYGAPATLFVAKFFSQNGLNLFPARLEARAGEVPVATPNTLATAPSVTGDFSVLIGIRPEDMVVVAASSDNQAAPHLLPLGEAEIFDQEFYGSYHRLTFNLPGRDGETVVACTNAMPPSRHVYLYAVRNRAFVFDGKGVRIDAQV